MIAEVQKWGNSMAFRIPSAYAKDLGLKLKTKLEIKISDGQLVATPIVKRKYNLKDLVSRVTPENTHGECDWGGPVGMEIIEDEK